MYIWPSALLKEKSLQYWRSKLHVLLNNQHCLIGYWAKSLFSSELQDIAVQKYKKKKSFGDGKVSWLQGQISCWHSIYTDQLELRLELIASQFVPDLSGQHCLACNIFTKAQLFCNFQVNIHKIYLDLNIITFSDYQ